MKFNNPNEFLKWKDINLERTLTQWGGEGAGNIYTDYLHPEILETQAPIQKCCSAHSGICGFISHRY